MREREIAKLYANYFSFSDDIKQMFEKTLMHTYAVKEEALAKCILHLMPNYRNMDDVQRVLHYLDKMGYSNDIGDYIQEVRKFDPEWAEKLAHIAFEYGKNGHEILSGLTPIHEMSPDQLDAYILKIKENTALKGEKTDEEICGEMLSVFAETGTILTYDEIKHFVGAIDTYSDVYKSGFTVGIMNGNYYAISRGKEAIALPIEKASELDRDLLMSVAERALSRANQRGDDLSTTTLTDAQVRRRLTAYTFVAMQYQGIARELVKELTPHDFEDKTPPPPERKDTYDELIEQNNRQYLDRLNREKLYEEEMNNKDEEIEEDYGMSL